MKKKKEFDCVEMKDKIQAEIQKRMAVMTPEEEQAHWDARYEVMLERRNAILAQRKAS